MHVRLSRLSNAIDAIERLLFGGFVQARIEQYQMIGGRQRETDGTRAQRQEKHRCFVVELELFEVGGAFLLRHFAGDLHVADLFDVEHFRCNVDNGRPLRKHNDFRLWIIATNLID